MLLLIKFIRSFKVVVLKYKMMVAYPELDQEKYRLWPFVVQLFQSSFLLWKFIVNLSNVYCLGETHPSE